MNIRTPKDRKAPVHTLQEAEDIVRKINNKYGTTPISLDLMPQFLGLTSSISGTFRVKIASLRKLGLIENAEKDQIRISSLGQRLVTPTDDDEADEAKRESILGLTLMSELSEKYTDGNFPDDVTILSNQLQRNHNVKPQHVKGWLNFIKTSAHLLKVTEKGDLEKVDDSNDNNTKVKSTEENKKDDPSNHEMSIGLSNNTVAKISVPRSMTKKDKEKLNTILEALINNDDNEET